MQKPAQFSPATREQIDEIENILPSSGLSTKEALEGCNGAAGGQIISVMQLSQEAASKVLLRLYAAIEAQQGKGA